MSNPVVATDTIHPDRFALYSPSRKQFVVGKQTQPSFDHMPKTFTTLGGVRRFATIAKRTVAERQAWARKGSSYWNAYLSYDTSDWTIVTVEAVVVDIVI